MKLIISGDWQLEATPPHDRVNPATNRSTRFTENVETIAEALKAGLAAGAEGLVHLGDLTEHKKPVPLELDAAADLFNVVLGPGHRVWAIAGNHDGSLYEFSSSSISPLARMRTDAFKLFHSVQVDEELGMLAVPYLHGLKPADVATEIEEVLAKRTDPRKLFAAIHYGVIGKDGTPCATGAHNSVQNHEYLSAAHLSGEHLDMVAFGHIHKSQTLDMTDTLKAYGPGSPVICDLGEREDLKSYLLFDTVTREVTRHEIAQRRRWISVPYDPSIGADPAVPAPWGPDDIVGITGTYEHPDYPKDTLEAAFKAGMVRPFSLGYSTRKAQVERALRTLDLTEGAGLVDAVKAFARDNFPSAADSKPGQMEPAVNLAISAIVEQGLQMFGPEVTPIAIVFNNFRTFKTQSHAFRLGEPTLITGKNGIGKSNFDEGVFWCCTGESSKGDLLSAAVRQECNEGGVAMTLAVRRPDEQPILYRINRTVKVNKKDAAAQKLTLHKQEADESWTDLSDGGVAETQTIIDNLLGGSAASLRSTNFRFQTDKFSIIGSHPTARQAIIGEIGGLRPLQKASVALEKRRKESVQAADAMESRMSGMLAAAAGAAERLVEAEKALVLAASEEEVQKAALPAAEAAEATALTNRQGAEAAVTAIQAQLDALPNTAADLAAAEQSIKTYQKTYEDGHAAKLARHATLKADIAKTEAALAAVKAPDPAALATLEAGVARLKEEHRTVQSQHQKAVLDHGSAEASANAASHSVATARGLLAKAEADLKALPAAEDAGALGATLKADEGALGVAEADVTRLAGEKVTATAAVTALGTKRQELLDERAAFDGQDVGACSKCGHALDSTHLTEELARIDAALKALDLEAPKLTETAKVIQEAFGKAALAKMTLATKVNTAKDKIHALELAAQTRAGLVKSVADAGEQVHELAQDAQRKALEADALKAAAEVLAPLLAAKDAEHTALAADLLAKQTAGSEIGRLQGQLATQRKQFDDNLAAGKAEAAAFEVELKRLGAVIFKAAAEHEINEGVAGVLRGQLATAQPAASAAIAAWGHAQVVAQKVRGDLAAAIKAIADAQAKIKEVHDQQAAVAASEFELKMLKERAEIDTLAANLLDPKKGVPNRLIDGMLPFLQERVNTYMEAMGMGRLAVELTTLEGNKETLAILIDNGRPGRKLDISEYSGSQVDRIEYALQCAFGDLQRQARGVTFGYACFDEPAGLDEEGTRGLAQLLRDRCVYYPATYIVSHDERLIRSFDSRLNFTQGPADETLVA